MKKIVFLCFVILFSIITESVFSEESSYTALVTDSHNNSYTLMNFSVAGYKHFTCRLQNSYFRIEFERIRSVQITQLKEPAYKGYSDCVITYTAGGQANVLLRTESYWVEGTEENLQIKLTIPLSEISTIDLISE